MSSYVCDILASLNARKEENILWVDTYYLDLKPYTIGNWYYGCVWISEKQFPNDFRMVLEFRFARIHEMVFQLTCIRTPVTLPPSKYRLEFHCSVNVFDQDPIVLMLESDRMMVSQAYDLTCTQFCVTPNGRTTKLKLKIIVKMIKYDCDSSPESNSHHEGEFTGHQIEVFADLKTTYITRADRILNKIAEYKEANVGTILNYVLNDELKQIDYKDLFEMYMSAHRMGLSILLQLSRYAILERIGNPSFLIGALGVADRVGDTFLFAEVSKTYATITREQLEPEDSKNLRGSTIEWQFMKLSLNRQLEKKQSKSQVEIGESSKSCTITCPSSNGF